MPGSRITKKQEDIYMKSRQTGLSQEVAAARSGVSVRSGRRIERGERTPVPHYWRTREDPLGAVWETHLAAALGHQLIELEVRCKLFPAVALVQELQRAKQRLELMSYLSRLDKYRVIILDDIGYVRKTDSETQVLFEFIAHCYESGSLIITSNQPFSEWDAIFPDNVMTVAAIDRLIHHATIIKLEGGSYR